MSDRITIPRSVDGLREALDEILSDPADEVLAAEIRYRLRHAKIRREYQRLKSERDYGTATQIQAELAEKYLGSSDKVHTIRNIIYSKY